MSEPSVETGLPRTGGSPLLPLVGTALLVMIVAVRRISTRRSEA